MNKTHYKKEISELLNAPEGEHFEFKEAKNRYDLSEAVKYCCALSNCGGGSLILGVSDKRPRQVVGSQAFEQPERTVKLLMDKLQVRVDFDIYEHDGKRVLAFRVASRPVGLPVQTDGIVWWRDGDSLVHMPQKLLRSIYAEAGHDFSADICHDVTINDLDNGAIKKFRKRWRAYSGNTRIENLSDEQILRDCGALTDRGVTYAALILFGKSEVLKRQLPHAEVVFEYRSKESAGPAAQRAEFREGFFNFVDGIWELVNLRNDNQHYPDGFALLPVPTFRELVVREALLNAVSHRNYQLGGSVFVRQYNNRLVIESPGGFPFGVTVDNVLDRQNARNFLISDIFRVCGLVERSGQGMNFIYEMAIKDSKPLPDFSGSDEYFVKLTLIGKVVTNNMLSFIKKIDDERLEAMTTDDYLLLCKLFQGKSIKGIKSDCFEHLEEMGLVRITENGVEIEDGSISIINDWQAIETSDWQAIESDRKKQILAVITKNGTATSAQLAEALGITQVRIRAILKELVEAGIISKIGDYRYTHYTLKNRGDQNN